MGTDFKSVPINPGSKHTFHYQSLRTSNALVIHTRIGRWFRPLNDIQIPVCAGPQYVRRDIQVSLAPSVSAHLCDVRLRLHRPRLPCVRNDTAHRAASMLPQWLYGAMRLLLRPSTRAYLVLRALASLSLARSERFLSNCPLVNGPPSPVGLAARSS